MVPYIRRRSVSVAACAYNVYRPMLYACIQYRRPIRRIVAYTILRIKARTLAATCVDSWSISRHAVCDADGGECIHRNLVRLLAAATQSRRRPSRLQNALTNCRPNCARSPPDFTEMGNVESRSLHAIRRDTISQTRGLSHDNANKTPLLRKGQIPLRYPDRRQVRDWSQTC